MSTFHAQESSGAQTFTAVSARLNLSGLDDDFSPLVDPNLLDTTAPDWFNSPGAEQGHQHHHYQHHSLPHAPGPPLSPQHEHGSFGFGGPGAYPSSHRMPATAGSNHEAMHGGPQYPPLSTHSMNGIHIHNAHDVHAQSRLDDLGAISPLQTTYPPYATPYPDSTASSAPSEEQALVADVADEDKRKRNQAASARFRQKKKQREAQMLEQSRDMQEKNKKLENEVEGLKRENTFLKKLLVEKVDNMSIEDKAQLAKSTGLDKKL